MCEDALPEDLTKSRFRWFDLPAILLYHRAVRCKLCDHRYFSLRHRKSISVLSHLWMHYAILISVACIAVGLYKFQQQAWTESSQAFVRQPSQISQRSNSDHQR